MNNRETKSCKEEYEGYIFSNLTQPLTDNVLNYNSISDTIYWPILLDNYNFEDCTVATCCWNAYESNIFNMLLKENKICAICRGDLLQCYVTIYDYYHNIYPNCYPKLGVNLYWSIGQLKTAIETKTKYKNISKIMLGRYNLLSYNDKVKLSDYGIRNCSILRIW